MVKLGTDGGLQMAFSSGQGNSWRLAVVDMDGKMPTIKTCYGPRPDYPYGWEATLKRLASGRWAEVKR